MLAEIENAVLSALEAGGLDVRDLDVQKGASGIAAPAAFVAIERGAFKQITAASGKLRPVVSVLVVFKDLKSEKARRHGAYPLLEGVLGLLAYKTLGLSIDPLVPGDFYNVTDDDLARAGLCAYQADFTTGYGLSETTDDQAADWLRLGLEYFLQDPEDDGAADAADLVDLEE